MTVASVVPQAVPHPEALLIELASGAPAVAGDVAAWYAERRLPAHLVAPGCTRAGYYTDTDLPVSSLAAYQFATAADLDRVERDPALRPQGDGPDRVVERTFRFERRRYRLLGCYQDPDQDQARDPDQDEGQGQEPVLLAVWWEPRPGAEADLDAWYAEEHIPRLLAVPGWLRITRYERAGGTGPRFLALHDLADVNAMNSPGHRAATDTPWRTKVIAQREHYERRVFTLHTQLTAQPQQHSTGGAA
jgi:hypothetical protein